MYTNGNIAETASEDSGKHKPSENQHDLNNLNQSWISCQFACCDSIEGDSTGKIISVSQLD